LPCYSHDVVFEQFAGVESAEESVADPVVVGSSDRPSSSEAVKTIADDNFLTIFRAACKGAYDDILDDNILALSMSKHGGKVVELAKRLSQHSDEMSSLPIADFLRPAFINQLILTASDKDNLMRSVHAIRLSPVVLQCFKQFVNSKFPTNQTLCRLLMQIWLRKLLARMLNGLLMLRRPTEIESGLPDPLTDTDQGVLYYVSGYIAMRLVSSSRRNSKLSQCSQLIKFLSSDKPQEGHFVHKYNAWVQKQSRGGLSYPIPDFFLLIRELDLAFRQMIIVKGLGFTSVNQLELRSAMLASFMVKLYWSKIVIAANAQASTCQPVLGFVVTLFITIKGFAVARNEKERLTAVSSRKQTDKGSKSFRGKLKKC
jgi:hypothetical protein